MSQPTTHWRVNPSTGDLESPTDRHVGENTVETASIEDSAVTTAKVADAAITTAKLNDGAATAAKLGTSSVTAIKLDPNMGAYADAAALRAAVDTLTIGRKVHTVDAVTAGDGGGASGGEHGYWEVVARESLTDNVWGVVTNGGANAAVRRYSGDTVWAAWRGITTASANVSALLNGMIASVPLGSTIQLGPGTFACVDPINVNRRVTLRGTGTGTDTKLKWAAPYVTDVACVTVNAKWAAVERLTVEGWYQEAPGGAVRDTLRMRESGRFELCYAAWATGQGITVSASQGADGSNANGYQILRCYASLCEHGIEIGAFGLASDVNAGTISGCWTIGNRSIGLLLSGGLGSNVAGHQSEGNGDFGYESSDDVDYTVLTGCYLEAGDLHRLRAPVIVVGGHGMGQVDPTLSVGERASIFYGTTSGTAIAPDLEAVNTNTLTGNVAAFYRIGNRALAGSAAAFGVRDLDTGADVQTFRLEYGRSPYLPSTTEDYRWNWREGIDDLGVAFSFIGLQHPLGQRGYTVRSKLAANYMALGGTEDPVILTSYFENPMNFSGGRWERGDFNFNTSPSVGGPFAWQCTAGDGTANGTHVGLYSASGNTTVQTRGDVIATLTAGDPENQIWNTTLTASRAITLSTTGAWNGAQFRITRTGGGGGHTLDVGGLTTLSQNDWCVVVYTGSAWVLLQKGTLT